MSELRTRIIRPAPYTQTYDAMRAFTKSRTPETPDQLWLCEHSPVYTLGQASQPEHIITPYDIPVIQTDRGGQITYHGPGQVVAYILNDTRRKAYYIKDHVRRIEQAVIATLADYGVTGILVDGAPGVYVRTAESQTDTTTPQLERFQGLAKISALGVKVSNHCTYHGVSLNVKMDLQPFSWINPCGYEGLKTVDMFTMKACLAQNTWENAWEEVALMLAKNLEQML